ncbi:MAG TPA: hypothetical protein VG650_17170 [Mycobacteriales bacterium]|nr:hypothetical protein [Mycobacteriales bacterium]
MTSTDAWNAWLDAHAEWRRTTANVVQGRTTLMRPAPAPPTEPLPTDNHELALRIAAALDDLAQLREQAAHRISGELHAALAYRTDGAITDVPI